MHSSPAANVSEILESDLNQRANQTGLHRCLPVVVSGRLCKVARLRDEWYDFVADPETHLRDLRCSHPRADLFTFVQRLSNVTPHFPFYWEPEPAAVLPIQNYEHWWKKQINDKTRNMVRKAQKKGVTITQVGFGDDLVAQIKGIYDESPLRQGRPFKHFQKSHDVLKQEHSSYLDRSEFFGAYLGGELIGFVKLVFQGQWASMMNIIARISERDKAPTNALIAKAVERCAEKGVGLLQYGTWSRRTIGDFKLHHGFERREVPRYFVPLSWKGRLLLQFGGHRSPLERLPGSWIDRLTLLRTRYNQYRYGK